MATGFETDFFCTDESSERVIDNSDSRFSSLSLFTTSHPKLANRHQFSEKMTENITQGTTTDNSTSKKSRYELNFDEAIDCLNQTITIDNKSGSCYNYLISLAGRLLDNFKILFRN